MISLKNVDYRNFVQQTPLSNATTVPLDGTHLDAVRGLFEQTGFVRVCQRGELN